MNESNCTASKPATSETDSIKDQCPPQTNACSPGIVGSSPTGAGSASGDKVSLLSEGMTDKTVKSAWRIRNANTTARRIEMRSLSQGWSFNFVAPAHTDVYVLSGVGRVTHEITAYASDRPDETRVTGVESKKANNSPFINCD